MAYLRPVSGATISSTWADHKNRRPPSGEPGTDYACAYGTTVVSPAAGKIITTKSDNSGPMGRRIIIQFDDGNAVDIIHLSKLWLGVGARVLAGQAIGKSGASAGGSNWGVGPHVHISLWLNGNPFTKGWAATADFEAFVFDQVTCFRQMWLNANRGEKLVADGVEGALTRQAYIRYQRVLGVNPDGEWGPATERAHQEYIRKHPSKPNPPSPSIPSVPSTPPLTEPPATPGKDIVMLIGIGGKAGARRGGTYQLNSNGTARYVGDQFLPGVPLVVDEKDIAMLQKAYKGLA